MQGYHPVDQAAHGPIQPDPEPSRDGMLQLILHSWWGTALTMPSYQHDMEQLSAVAGVKKLEILLSNQINDLC